MVAAAAPVTVGSIATPQSHVLAVTMMLAGWACALVAALAIYTVVIVDSIYAWCSAKSRGSRARMARLGRYNEVPRWLL